MANKFKRVNHASQKVQNKDNTNLRTLLGLAAVAIIAIVIFIAYGSGANSGNQTTNTGAPQTNQQPSMAQLQQRVRDMEKAVQTNPNNIENQKLLGDAYYDVGFAYLQQNDTTNSQTYFAKAVEPYQKYLAQKFDINVQTDMSTAAFYGNKLDIAEAGFKTAIEKRPDFMTAHLNYGIFLRDAKKDNAAAKEQFTIVANQSKDANEVEQAKQLLQTVQ